MWLIAALPLDAALSGRGVAVSRSTDGGLTWGTPVLVTTTESGTDKDWITCDNTPTSPFYGHCYVEWDWNAQGNRIQMSTSTDGGLTWGPALATADGATGLGGQPLVQPNGTVIVPIDNAVETSVLAFQSTSGGASWSSTTPIASIVSHGEAGNLRSEPLASAAMDGAGTVYVVWQDCRFEAGCTANDLVLSTSPDGRTWSAVRRLPLDAVGSAVDHFIPGLAADRATQGSSAHLALVYYYYPVSTCGTTCQLDVGYVTSPDGGASWTAPLRLAGPMSPSWLASTTQGLMVGDYIATTFSGGRAFPVLAVAQAPLGGVFQEALETSASGLVRATEQGPLLAASSGAPPLAPATAAGPTPGAPRTAH